jgi:hypothetical protein
VGDDADQREEKDEEERARKDTDGVDLQVG